MSNKTIAKFSVLVIVVAFAQLFAQSCSHVSPKGRYTVDSAGLSLDYEKPVTVGTIQSNDVNESSGIAASLCQPDVLWTHNDSGDDAFLYAMDLKGNPKGTWRVTGARNIDWEDIATFKDPAGHCFVYIGDIGNNKLARAELKIYRIEEPAVSDATANSNKKNPLEIDQAEVVTFKYSDTPHDAETLMVQPQTADIYVLTKRLDGPSLVFKIAPPFATPGSVVAQKVGEVSVPAVPNGLLTGGEISPDGKRVIVCDLSAGYELHLGDAVAFDDIWKSRPVTIDLGDRKQGEAVTFSADGRSVLATSEGKDSRIVEVKRK